MAVGDKRDITRQLNSSHGSYELVVSPAILALLGYWLDTKLGSGPWIMIALGVLGLTGAVVRLYLDYQLKMAAAAEQDRARREAASAERRAERQAAAAEREAAAARLTAELEQASALERRRTPMVDA